MYIFSINAGRSGSGYLAGLLDTFENILAVHEATPILNGKIMNQFNNGSNLTTLTLMTENKLKDIILNSKGYDAYIDTSHIFIKSFGWIIPNLIDHDKIGIVYLQRDKEKIVKSHFRLNCTPLTFKGKKWLLSPIDSNNILRFSFIEKLKFRFLFLLNRIINSEYNPISIKKPRFIERNEIIYLKWYVDETEARLKVWKNRFPKIKVFETHLEKLNEKAEVLRLLSFFNIEHTESDKLDAVLGEKVNEKKHFKLPEIREWD